MIYAVSGLITRPRRAVIAAFVIVVLSIAAPAFVFALESKPAEREQNLTDIVKHTMTLYFEEKTGAAKMIRQYADNVKVRPEFQKPAGVFVTLSRKGKTRGCWGSIHPQHSSVAKSVVYATMGALGKEYRYKPIKPSETKFLKPQVTVVRAVEPVASISMVNPFRDGVLVRAGGKSGVILPGEASDAYYELVMAKLKAGIQPNEPCQIYKLKADIYD